MNAIALALGSTVLAIATLQRPEEARVEDTGQIVDFKPHVWGLLLPVPDVPDAARFYTSVLGFEAAGFADSGSALLRSGEFHLSLVRVDDFDADPKRAGVYMNLHVDDLEAISDSVRAAGGQAGEPEVFPLGRAVDARDPFGHRFHLLDVTVGDGSALTGTGIFNLGVSASSFPSIEAFLGSIGFEVYSRDYLPTALPYQKSGVTALVAHDGADQSAPEGDCGGRLLLSVPALSEAVRALERRGVDGLGEPHSSLAGRAVSLRSGDGVQLRLIEHSPAQLAFERLRELHGSWRGESSAGWEAAIEIEVIAGGTVVLQRSNFAAHPGQAMITAYHRDVDRLVLTHYCVAGNQPTLEASDFAADGLSFVYASATNIASRDEGHMDSLRLTFVDDDHFQSRWSWYQSGSETWMEEIRYEREVTDPR